MTALLTQAFEEASQLSAVEQDALAERLLAEFESERRWAKAFAESADLLTQFAEEATEAKSQTQTTPLDFDR
jgi:hypothetical protein